MPLTVRDVGRFEADEPAVRRVVEEFPAAATGGRPRHRPARHR